MKSQTTMDGDLILDSHRQHNGQQGTRALEALAGCVLLLLKPSPKPNHLATAQLHPTSIKFKNMTGGPTVFCP